MVVFLYLWKHTMVDIFIIMIIVDSRPKAQFLMFYLHILNEVAIHVK